MSYQNGGADSVEQSGDRIGVDLCVERAGVGRHLPEVLVQYRRVLRKLHAREVGGPDSQPEDVERSLFVTHRVDGDGLRTAASSSSTRLIDGVHDEPATQENRVVPLAAIRRGLPGLG